MSSGVAWASSNDADRGDRGRAQGCTPRPRRRAPRRARARPERAQVRREGAPAIALGRGVPPGAPARAQEARRGDGGVRRRGPGGAGRPRGVRARRDRGVHARSAGRGRARGDRRRRDRGGRRDVDPGPRQSDGRRDAAGLGARGRVGRQPTRPREARLSELVRWARALQALAQTGLSYAEGPYDRERYEAVQRIAAEMAAAVGGEEPAALLASFAEESGYRTPKVDVRGVVLTDEGL